MFSSDSLAKIIRDCDKVVIDGRIVEEYVDVLTRQGFNQQLVLIKLQDLHIRQKLVDVSRKTRSLENIVTHEKDRSFIESAYVSNAIIITNERRHLLDCKDKIMNDLGIEVIDPVEYIKYNKKNDKEQMKGSLKKKLSDESGVILNKL